MSLVCEKGQGLRKEKALEAGLHWGQWEKLKISQFPLRMDGKGWQGRQSQET